MPRKTKERNLYFEAFIHQYNLIFLAFLVILSIVTTSFVPLLAAIGLQMLYLGLIPETAFFQRVVEEKYAELEEEERAAKMAQRLGKLHPAQRRRYDEIKALVDGTRENLSDADPMGRSIRQKLERLMDRYLWLIELLNVYEGYLVSVNRQELSKNIVDVNLQLESASGRVERSLRDRLDVLERRQLRLDRVRENHDIVRNQIMTVEDILRLVRESSMTVQNPQDIGRQLDDLLIDVEATEEAVQTIEGGRSSFALGGGDAFDQFDRQLEEALEDIEQDVSVHIR